MGITTFSNSDLLSVTPANASRTRLAPSLPASELIDLYVEEEVLILAYAKSEPFIADGRPDAKRHAVRVNDCLHVTAGATRGAAEPAGDATARRHGPAVSSHVRAGLDSRDAVDPSSTSLDCASGRGHGGVPSERWLGSSGRTNQERATRSSPRAPGMPGPKPLKSGQRQLISQA